MAKYPSVEYKQKCYRNSNIMEESLLTKSGQTFGSWAIVFKFDLVGRMGCETKGVEREG